MRRAGLVVLLAMCPFPVLAQDPPGPPALKEAFVATDRVHVSLAFSPDGKKLAAGGPSFVRVFDVPAAPAGKFVEARLLAQRGLVEEVAFDPRGIALLSRSREVDTQVWDARTWAAIRIVINNYSGDPPGLARSGPWLAFPNRGRGLRLWGLDGLDPKRRVLRRHDLTEGSGLSFDHVLAAATAGTDLFFGDAEGRLIRTPIDDQISAQANPLPNLTGEDFGQNRLRPPAPLAVIRAHRGPVLSVSATPEGRFCVTAGSDGKVRLWSSDQFAYPKAAPSASRRPPDPEPLWTLAGHAAEMSANGALLAVAEARGVGVYEVESGAAISWNPTGAGRVTRLRFSPDGRYLAAIRCACLECAGAEVVAPVRRRLQEHGGTLTVWK